MSQSKEVNSVSYRPVRYGQYIPYRLVNRCKYPPCFIFEKIPAIPVNIGHFGWKVKTGQYKKLLTKKKKKKSIKWLPSPSGSTPLCWSSLTFSWFPLRLPPSTSSVHFSSLFSFLFSFLLICCLDYSCHPVGPFVLCGSCSLILCVLTHMCKHWYLNWWVSGIGSKSKDLLARILSCILLVYVLSTGSGLLARILSCVLLVYVLSTTQASWSI